ncbi:T-cell immunoglobulin and mucin domain-containing protein 2-like [Onychomys torridus]|uniref:T-cell immunoglobulin and mucin domain-containing protein 2-like n=1 Tax=Onychomys torridus TaxID=38674 RepID=UPI00167F6617|nr:T-cell immunoglobulin and mucin domain-containing protein 2-like [Onychomys torridus]
MMHPQVFISGLILLLPGALGSYPVVEGVVGHPVTLPCTYSTNEGITTACWGLGECKSVYCARTLIWTNGYQVSYQRKSRYQLKGHISEGNVSLTIENALQSDSGPYCCIVEIPGSFRYVTYSLEVKPEIPTNPPTRPTTTRRPTTTARPRTISTRPTITTRPTTTARPRTISARLTHVPTSPRVSTSLPPTQTHPQTHTAEPTTIYPHLTTAEVTETTSYPLADSKNTVTSSPDSCNNYTESILSHEWQKNTTNGFFVGISMAVLLLLLLFVCTLAVTIVAIERETLSFP